MNVNKIQLINNQNFTNNYHKSYAVPVEYSSHAKSKSFESSASVSGYGYGYSQIHNISFGGYNFSENMFAMMFPKMFFRKISQNKIPCAYTGIVMIPQKDYDNFAAIDVFNKAAGVSLKFLKRYENSFFDVEKTIFLNLHKLAKKYPSFNIQQLLRQMLPIAQKNLISQQDKIFANMSSIAGDLHGAEYDKVHELLEKSYTKIMKNNALPKDRFSRKEFIYELVNINIKDLELKSKLISAAEKLPASSNSVDAFIVKYSQPYRIKSVNGVRVIYPQTSKDIALRLLKPSVATDEHIYPQTLFKQDAQLRKNGNETPTELRVTVLTTSYINALKQHTLIDDFIKSSSYNIVANVQNHFKKLIKLDEIWFRQGKILDAKKLADYIFVLKNEFELRSKLIKIELGNFESLAKRINSSSIRYKDKLASKYANKAVERDLRFVETFE